MAGEKLNFNLRQKATSVARRQKNFIVRRSPTNECVEKIFSATNALEQLVQYHCLFFSGWNERTENIRRLIRHCFWIID
jgi:hypothetical protein